MTKRGDSSRVEQEARLRMTGNVGSLGEGAVAERRLRESALYKQLYRAKGCFPRVRYSPSTANAVPLPLGGRLAKRNDTNLIINASFVSQRLTLSPAGEDFFIRNKKEGDSSRVGARGAAQNDGEKKFLGSMARRAARNDGGKKEVLCESGSAGNGVLKKIILYSHRISVDKEGAGHYNKN